MVNDFTHWEQLDPDPAQNLDADADADPDPDPDPDPGGGGEGLDQPKMCIPPGKILGMLLTVNNRFQPSNFLRVKFLDIFSTDSQLASNSAFFDTYIENIYKKYFWGHIQV